MQMQECGIKIWINLLILLTLGHNSESSYYIQHQVHMSKLFNNRSKAILKNMMISSHTQIIKILFGLDTLLQEFQLKDLLEILEDGFKLLENKFLKLNLEEHLMLLIIMQKLYKKDYGIYKQQWVFYNITMPLLELKNKKLLTITLQLP